MRVGVRLPQYGSTWRELCDMARRCDELGFDGLWMNDHLQSPGRRKDDPTFEAFTTLAAIAQHVRSRLGVVVASASYRAPGLTAKLGAMVDTMAPGGFVLGLGTGSDRAEHRAFGVPFPSPSARTARLVETLDVLRAMSASPTGATVVGVIDGAPNVPAAAPPIWVAAHRPRLLRLAGERADGIVAAFVTPEELAARRALADAARREVSRPPLACCLYTFALPDGADTTAWLRPQADVLGTTPARMLRWLRTTGIVAPATELRERLAGYSRAGATDAVLALPERVPVEAWDALAEAVL